MYEVTLKMLSRILGIILCVLYLTQGFNMPGKKSWNFEFVSLETESSDNNLAKIDLQLTRISRGSYGITGTITVNFDIKDGDQNEIEALVYRSATGSDEYKLTPFTMPKQHFYKFLNSFYKDILMDSLAKCSDLPTFKDKFQPPLEKKTYKLDNCQITNEGLPPYMNEGFYKVRVIGTGDVNYAFDAIVQVENDN